MIADFVIEKMAAYIAGGMAPETAARFTRGELESIYRGLHRRRNDSGAWITTSPPEVVNMTTAMAICETAIAGVLKRYAEKAGPLSDGKAPDESQTVYRSSAAVKHTVAAGVGIKWKYQCR